MEDGVSTSSLSKGCFLFNGASYKPGTVLTGSFQTLPGETSDDAAKRASAYQEHWSLVKQSIEEIMSSHHNQLLNDVVKFICSASKSLSFISHTATHSTEDSSTVSSQPRLEIPTAVVVAGVNMPDHDILFEQLKKRIVAMVTTHVVQLHSTTCNSGMKTTWKEILVQLSQTVGSEDTEDGVPSQQRLPLPSLSILHSWYQETHPLPSNRPPIVIIINDFEGFHPNILQDLFMCISPHLGTLPVVFILSVATSAAAIHALPRSSSSLLCLEQFNAPSSLNTLTHLIKKILLSPDLPFKLGHQGLQFLLHQFICTSLSILQLTHTLQISMLEHFHWQPLSIIISKWDSLESIVDSLNHNQCEMIRATPSFRKYIENLESPEEQIALLTNDEQLKEVTLKLLYRVKYHQLIYPPLLMCLHILTENLPSVPLGKKLHDIYLLCMERHIVEYDKFDTAWNLLRLTSREGLSLAAEKCIAILKEWLINRDSDSPVSSALNIFQKFQSSLEQLDRKITKDKNEEDGGHIASEALTTSERKMKFQERLRQVASRKKEPSAFERVRATFLEDLLPCFRDGLIPPQELPLYEIIYFNNASSLKKHLMAAPRVSLHIALTKPAFYLPSAATSVTEHSSLSSQMPDICIVYQLHLECGRLINLFDWLCSFVAVVDPKAAEKLANQEGGRGSKDDIDPTLHARFIQAVSELQLLGFIKPTQKKTDHVQRLTWGAC